MSLTIEQLLSSMNLGGRGRDTPAERNALMSAYGTAQGSMPAVNQQLGPAVMNQINQSGIAERGISTAAERQFMEGAYQEALGKNMAENDLRAMRETGVPSQRIMGLLSETGVPSQAELDSISDNEMMKYLQNSTADQQAKIYQNMQMQNQTPIIDPLMNFFEGLIQGN